MAGQGPRFAFVTSTAGSVMNELLGNEFLRSHVHAVVADRPCDALVKAAHHGIPTRLIDAPTPEPFCRELAQHLQDRRIDYVLSFYTQFYAKDFRDRFRHRIVNSHPSLLPAFKGMRGFEDGIAYHCRIVGSTTELIRDVMDEGAIVIQAATAVDLSKDLAVTRHRVFVQQCKSMLQTVKWIVDGRLSVDGDEVLIRDARYGGADFSPALDFDQAIEWVIPMPERLSWWR
jgi:phosphoribosylglycinamide formyltransferase-1